MVTTCNLSCLCDGDGVFNCWEDKRCDGYAALEILRV